MITVLVCILLFLQAFLWLHGTLTGGSLYGAPLRDTLIFILLPFGIGLALVFNHRRAISLLAFAYGVASFLLFGFLGLFFIHPDDAFSGHFVWSPNRIRLVCQASIGLLVAILSLASVLTRRRKLS